MTGVTLTTLVIYAYTSFTSSWGPGPSIALKFEKKCKCHVELVDAGDGSSIISRLKLEQKKTEADVIIGLDETVLPKIKKDLGWTTEPIAFDYGPLAFVYNSNEVKNPPASLDDLLNAQWKNEIILEDPRLSTTGLGFLLWVVKEKGDGAWDYFKKLKPQVKIVSPSWDLAYGLFKKNQAKLVFSYWSSPAYHVQEEKRFDFKAAPFTTGNYVQTEYMFSVPGQKNHQLKADFLKFMLSLEAQMEIPKKNFMYPVNSSVKLTPAFEQIGKVKQLKALTPDELKNLDTWLKKWREIFS